MALKWVTDRSQIPGYIRQIEGRAATDPISEGELQILKDMLFKTGQIDKKINAKQLDKEKRNKALAFLNYFKEYVSKGFVEWGTDNHNLPVGFLISGYKSYYIWGRYERDNIYDRNRHNAWDFVNSDKEQTNCDFFDWVMERDLLLSGGYIKVVRPEICGAKYREVYLKIYKMEKAIEEKDLCTIFEVGKETPGYTPPDWFSECYKKICHKK